MKKRNIFIVLGVSLVLIVGVLLLLNYTGFLSIALGAGWISCTDAGTNRLSCSPVKGDISGSLGKIRFQIEEPDSRAERDPMLCNKLQYVTGSGCPPCPITGWACDDWKSKQYKPVLKKPLMIVKGQYSEEGGDRYTPIEGNFEAYGLCIEELQYCWVYDPFPDEHRYLHISSMTIYYKEGGYELTLEQDVCNEFNICPKINIYRLINDQCKFMIIEESERGVNDYDTLNECEENIITEKCYAYLESCKEVPCDWTQYTLYDSLNECELDNIPEPPKPTLFRWIDTLWDWIKSIFS